MKLSYRQNLVKWNSECLGGCTCVPFPDQPLQVDLMTATENFGGGPWKRARAICHPSHTPGISLGTDEPLAISLGTGPLAISRSRPHI